VIAAPGTCIVKLTAGRKEFTQKLIVKKDPYSARRKAIFGLK